MTDSTEALTTAAIARPETRRVEDHVLARDLRSYLRDVMHDLRTSPVSKVARSEPATVAESVIDVLFGRQFSYLGRARARVYEDAIRSTIVRSAGREEPIPFYFDIGGGYHATVQPGKQSYTFDVGLGELFVLAQIARLRQAVAQVYAPGVRFSLVIDNLCALLVNDIPLVKTLDYCTRLRHLIEGLHLEDRVSVLVESENFSSAELESATLAASPAQIAPMTPKRHRNVERFLGRTCTEKEALERELRYHAVVWASERQFDRIIDGVHMTQRASPTTMCFRPFPGGDSRIQSGQVVMTRKAGAAVHPMLMTSTNIDRYSCTTFRFPDLLPREVDHVVFATPVATSEPLGTT